MSRLKLNVPLLIQGGSKGYRAHPMKCEHDSDDSSSTEGSADSSGVDEVMRRVRSPGQVLVKDMRHEGRERRQVHDVAGERMEEADGCVLVPAHDQKAVDRQPVRLGLQRS